MRFSMDFPTFENFDSRCCHAALKDIFLSPRKPMPYSKAVDSRPTPGGCFLRLIPRPGNFFRNLCLSPMLYLTAAGIDGHLIMKVKFFKRCVPAAAMAILTGFLSPLSSPAQTQPDSSPLPADNSPTPGELPPYIFPTSPLAQVVRLTQAGVDQSIILTYVTNSSSTFNLDSDKIIYLRDVGLPNEIITAMMQRDQLLQQQMAAAAYQPPSQPAPPPDTSTEPLPPPPEDQPAPPPTEVTVNTFYDTLAPYGTWVTVDGYGRCWRPSVMVYNSGWQPYCDHGHWVYTNCGWYWCSDYSWGWAPFHYGRWFQHPHMGWCWTPDTVWGPSWVTWRQSNGYCGWAPLPPFATYQSGVGFFYRGSSVSIGFNWGLNQNCFTFVPTQYFCDPQPRRHCVGPAQVTQIFNQTTIINNFNGHGHDLANRGIDPDHISTVTRTPIRPVTIRDITSPPGHGPHGDQLSHDGSTLLVSRPMPSWSSGQNHSRPPADNRPGHPVQPARPTQVPVITTHGPQDGNGVRIPPQRPAPPANYNPSPTPAPAGPNHDNRTFSPRGWEQVHPPQPPRPNTYNSGTPAVTPAPNQGQFSIPAASHHNAPAAAPAPPPPPTSQPSSPPAPPPAPPSAPRSSNPNQNQSGTGYSPGSGYSPRH